MTSNGDGLLLKLSECAKLLGLSESSLRHLVERQRIPHRRIGRRIVFVKSEIETWINCDLPGLRLDELNRKNEL